MNRDIENILKLPNVWQASHCRNSAVTVPSEYPEIDQVTGGWTLGATTELLCNDHSTGLLELFLPALANRLECSDWLILIAPPFQPYAPAWQAAGIDPSRLLIIHPRNDHEKLWSTETVLRSGHSAAVLCWQGQTPMQNKDLRRLQLAAAEQQTLHLLWRPEQERQQSSPSAVRIVATAEQKRLQLEFIKQRGDHSGHIIHIDPLATKRAKPKNQLSNPEVLSTYVHMTPLPKRLHRRANSTGNVYQIPQNNTGH